MIKNKIKSFHGKGFYNPVTGDSGYKIVDQNGDTLCYLNQEHPYFIEAMHLIESTHELYDALEFFASLNLQSYNWLEPHILKAKYALLKAQGINT